MEKDSHVATDAMELRRRAEERLAIQPADLGGPPAEAQMQQLVRELKIRETEVEIQNEDLRAARAELDIARARNAELYDLAPVSYLSLTRDGAISQANRAAAELLGLECGAALGQPFVQFVAPVDRSAFNTLLHEVFAGPLPQYCDLTLVQNGQPTWIVQVDAIQSPDGQECRLVLADITELTQTTGVLGESEIRFRTLMEQDTDGIVIASVEGRCQEVNSSFCAMTGYSRDEILRTNVRELVVSEERALVTAEIEELSIQGSNLSEWNLRCKDGTVLPVEVNARRLLDGRLLGIVRDITERKRAEAALLESEERLSLAVAAADLGIFEHNHATDATYWSPTMRQIFAWPDDEPASLPAYLELTHPEDRSAVAAAVRRAHDPADNGEYRIEHRILRRDGRIRWIHVLGRTSFAGAAAERHPVITRGTVADITERKQAEKAQREDQARLQLLVQASNVGLWDWNVLTNDVYYSPEWKSQLGYADDELPGCYDAWESRLHPDDRARTLAAGKDFLENRSQEYALEFRMRHKDGSWRWISTRADLVRAPDGRPIRMMGCHIDITERKRAEEALRVREAQLTGIIGSAMDGIVTLDDELRIVLFNAAAEQLFGYTRAEILGQPIEMLLPERYRAQHRTHILKFASASITTRKMGGLNPIAARRSDGAEFPVEASISRIEVSGRKFFTAIVRDISERLRREAQIRDDSEQMRILSQKLLHAQEAERRHLARELHDEIGQVLCAISVNLKIAKTKVAPDALPQLDESTQIVDQAIDQVRNLSLDLRPSILDDYGLENALHWYADRLSTRTGLCIHLAAEPHAFDIPLEVRNVCFRVAQEALTNVVRHASARQVWIELALRQAELVLTIRDDGKGFDVEAARRRASKGESLGLLGMHERVKLLNGKTHLHSEPGKGTTIRIQVPLSVTAPTVDEEGA